MWIVKARHLYLRVPGEVMTVWTSRQADAFLFHDAWWARRAAAVNPFGRVVRLVRRSK